MPVHVRSLSAYTTRGLDNGQEPHVDYEHSNVCITSILYIASFKLSLQAIVLTKIVRRTLTAERAMSGALFAGGCQVWLQPPTAPSSHQSAGWQPKQLGPPLAQVLGRGGRPPQLWLKGKSVWPCKLSALLLLLLVLVHFAAHFIQIFPAWQVQGSYSSG